MDVKQYYRKIQEIENGLTEEFPFVVSAETSDGGKPGVINEVSRSLAAKLIAEGRAVLATSAQKKEHLERQSALREQARKADIARRLQVAIVTDSNLNAITSTRKTSVDE
jgi:hypothetical protein